MAASAWPSRRVSGVGTGGTEPDSHSQMAPEYELDRIVLLSVHYATNTCLPPGGECWLKYRSMFCFFVRHLYDSEYNGLNLVIPRISTGHIYGYPTR